MEVKIHTAPASEPVTIQEALDQVRTGGTDSERILTRLIKAARQQVERDTDRAVFTQTLDGYLDAWPRGREIWIPKGQLQSVSEIVYTPASGSPVTVDPATYGVDTVREPGRIVLNVGASWPTGALAALNPIRIRFVCGFSAVPEDLKHLMLLLIGHWWENTEAVALEQGVVAIDVPLTYTHLIRPWVMTRQSRATPGAAAADWML